MRNYIRTTLLASLLATAAPSASATCWINESLTRLTESVAEQHFPEMAQNAPYVYECPPEDLHPSSEAEYVPDDDVIIVPMWQRNSPPGRIRNVLGQSLAYAFLYRQNADPTDEFEPLLWERGLALADYECDFAYEYDY